MRFRTCSGITMKKQTCIIKCSPKCIVMCRKKKLWYRVAWWRARFCKHYFAIQQLRFGNAVQMTIEKDLPDQKQNCHVPPLSIQILIENAFKHNIFSEAAPLVITVTATREQVTVTNTPKVKNIASRAGTGLLNLDNRLQFIGNTSPSVDRSEKAFFCLFPIIQ